MQMVDKRINRNNEVEYYPHFGDYIRSNRCCFRVGAAAAGVATAMIATAAAFALTMLQLLHPCCSRGASMILS